MFERFTNRARHVVVLAQEEARGLQHNYIGTEHILLGLLGEPGGVAAQALDRFGVTLGGAREEVKGIIGIGKGGVSGHIPFTPRAKKTLELALREALQLNHNYIGTEHILLGVIREGEGVGAQVLKEHADLMAGRMAVLDLVPAGPAQARGPRWLRRLVTAGFGEPGEAGRARGAGEATPPPTAGARVGGPAGAAERRSTAGGGRPPPPGETSGSTQPSQEPTSPERAARCRGQAAPICQLACYQLIRACRQHAGPGNVGGGE